MGTGTITELSPEGVSNTLVLYYEDDCGNKVAMELLSAGDYSEEKANLVKMQFRHLMEVVDDCTTP